MVGQLCNFFNFFFTVGQVTSRTNRESVRFIIHEAK